MQRQNYQDTAKQRWFFAIDEDAIERARLIGVDLHTFMPADLLEMCREMFRKPPLPRGKVFRVVQLLAAAQLGETPQHFTVDIPTLVSALVAFRKAMNERWPERKWDKPLKDKSMRPIAKALQAIM